jgi:hypothetical protein
MNLTQRPIYPKPEPAAPDLDHMGRVAELPCVICHEYGLPQNSRTTVHHVIHGRNGNRRVPDTMTIPLCEGHHQGLRDTTKVAVHRSPDKWKRLYGEDHEWLSWVERRLGNDPR